MRKNVTIGFSEAEILRLQGAAAMARVPLATYLRWLIQGKADDKSGQMLSAILGRLDEVVAAVASLPVPEQPQAAARPPEPLVSSRERFAARMRERGIPTSMIRQVFITLEQLEGGSWPESVPR